MNPVTGPFNKVTTMKGSPIYTGGLPNALLIQQKYYKQAMPHNLVLAYDLDKRWCSQRVTVGTYEGAPDLFLDGLSYDAPSQIPIRNKAYEKFKSAVEEQSQWANNLYEASKTFDIGINAVKSLITFTRKIKRNDFDGAAKSLGITRPRDASKRQRFSDNWLAYHFGIEPLVQDIHAGMKALCRDFSDFPVSGKASDSQYSRTQVRNGTQGNNIVYTRDCKAKLGGRCRIVNPNISLLEEWGLVNPASFAWEVVPFSFVVDWFANVGQVLSSASDFMGKQFTAAYTTNFQTTSKHTHSWGVVPGTGGPPAAGPWYTVWRVDSCYLRRSSGITGPTLTLKPFKGFSVIRGATAVSLLLQFLK